MTVVYLDTEAAFTEFISTDSKVLVEFGAEWCMPCKKLLPVLESVSEEIPELRIGRVDIDVNFNLAADYNIMSVPTLVLHDGGGLEIGRLSGGQTKNFLVSWIRNTRNYR